MKRHRSPPHATVRTPCRNEQATSSFALSATGRPAALAAMLAAWVALTASANPGWNTGAGGRSERCGLSSQYGPPEATLSWQGGRPAIVAQQAVCKETILVSSRIESFDIPTGTWVVAQHLDTGEELWAVQLPYDFPGTSWRSRVSAIRDGRVYATRSGNTNPDYLYALDARDGSILWRSESLIDEGSTESLAFAPDGDLIVGNLHSLVRIECTDGSTVWEVSRSAPSSDGQQAAVCNGKVYVWEASGSGPIITASDLETGERLYSSEPIAGGLVQQLGPFCSPGGTIFAPRSQNNPSTDYLAALEDTGEDLVEKWRFPLPYLPFGTFGVGPDGSIYAYSRDYELVRLDPETGELLASSDPLEHDAVFKPRMAVSADGRVYVTNGGSSHGKLYAFSADLEMLWSESIYNVNLGGPVLGHAGTLVVCGTGTDIRAYRADPATAGTPWPEISGVGLSIPPVVRTEYGMILGSFTFKGNAHIFVVEASGRIRAALDLEAPLRGAQREVDLSGVLGGLEAGAYQLVLTAENGAHSAKVVVVK